MSTSAASTPSTETLAPARLSVVLGLQPSVEERRKLYALSDKAFARSKKPTGVEVSPVLDLKLDSVTDEVTTKLEPGNTIVERIKHVSQIFFHDESDERFQFSGEGGAVHDVNSAANLWLSQR